MGLFSMGLRHSHIDGGGQRWGWLFSIFFSFHPFHYKKEDKGGGEILEIFLLKFYLLNEKEKSKLYIQNPPMKLI
jgi:hypothetical protein